MQQTVARPDFAAQASPDHSGTDPNQLNEANVKRGGCTQFRGKLRVYAISCLDTTVNGPMNYGVNIVLNTSGATFVGRFLALSTTRSPTS